MEANKNSKTETYPFRKISTTSFIGGGLAVVLGIILLLTIKSDINDKSFLVAFEKLVVGLVFLYNGGKYIWRGYKNEYDFNLPEIFDPKHGKNVKRLLGQRTTNDISLANEYANILRSRAFAPSKRETGNVKDWQLLFYKLASKNKVSKLFDFLPYPITNFIASQSSPIALITFLLGLLVVCLFVTYLGIIPISFVYVNLFILVGLLSWWTPSKIDTLLKHDMNVNVQSKVILFVVFYVVTILFSNSYAHEINIGVFVSILVIAGVIIYTSLMSFNLIKSVFPKREKVNVDVSQIDLITHRVSTQPKNILQQFDNGMSESTGWFFKSPSIAVKDLLAGDNNRKGEFEFEYVYETWPKIISTTYDDQSEVRLSKIWKIGTIVFCLGLVLIFLGALILPAINPDSLQTDAQTALKNYSPRILTSLFLILFGIALYFFGNKLVYEVFTFFNTEVFFESDLILFGAHGNFDEFEHINGNLKRKDTSTDFTPDIKTCKVISSVFIHPYIDNEKIKLADQDRFLVSITKNDNLLRTVVTNFKNNISTYLMRIENDNITIQKDNSTITKNIDNE
jgi:hypothetical protein